VVGNCSPALNLRRGRRGEGTGKPVSGGGGEMAQRAHSAQRHDCRTVVLNAQLFSGKLHNITDVDVSPPLVSSALLPTEPLPQKIPERLDPGALQALIHLYRAEVGRMVTYRQRLDTTTNWAITLSALVTTFSIGNPLIPHAAFLFLMLVNVFFL